MVYGDIKLVNYYFRAFLYCHSCGGRNPCEISLSIISNKYFINKVTVMLVAASTNIMIF